MRSIESRPQHLRRLVLLELPAGQLLVLAAAVGALWAASLFDWSFVIGRHAFWQFPKGTISGSSYDMAQVLTAYFYYVQSSWHLPLFYVSALGTPTGTNIIFMDALPVVALAGRLIHSITGTTINLYGVYSFLSFSLPGVMMTLVLIAAKIRYALAAIIGAIFANAMPALLSQWGHIALGSHFLLIGALALYLFSLQKRTWRGLAGAWIAYLTLTYLTNIYLFAMIGIVWLCAIIQRRLNRLATTREALGTWALTVALVTTIALSGLFGGGTGLPFGRGYGDYSMNLLSPVMPQDSGLFPRAGGIIGATHGQYEGFNYLGFGLLLASLLVLPEEASWLRRNLRRHISLLVAFAALTAFAISNRVYAGHWLLFELPMPRYIVWGLGIFRASGRFFWLIGYAQLAITIVLSFRRAQLMMVLCLVSAAILQLFDLQPLREQIIASIAAGPGTQEFDPGEVARLIARARHVESVPSFNCTQGIKDELTKAKLQRANMELMLATARINVSTNTVFTGRPNFLTLKDVLRAPSHALEIMESKRADYCNQEIARVRSDGRPSDLIVLLSDRPRQEEMASGIVCSPLAWARYCERHKE
jgi:hypothetical protein